MERQAIAVARAQVDIGRAVTELRTAFRSAIPTIARAIENHDRTGMNTAKSLNSDMALKRKRRIVGDAGGGLVSARGIANQGIAQAGFEAGDLAGLSGADEGTGQGK